MSKELEKQVVDILCIEIEGGRYGINVPRFEKIERAARAIIAKLSQTKQSPKWKSDFASKLREWSNNAFRKSSGDRYFAGVSDGLEMASRQLESISVPSTSLRSDNEAHLRDIILRAEIYLREMNDGNVHDPSVGLYLDTHLIQLLSDIDDLPSESPSPDISISEDENKYTLKDLKESWEAAEIWALNGPYSKNYKGETIRQNPDFQTYFKSKQK